jgi:DNA-binding MarR family transcriptional regulator
MAKILAKLDLTGTGYCASLNFRRTSRIITRMYDTAMQDSGIRSTQFAVLVGIAKIQPVSIGALGKVLSIDPTTLTRSLRLLKKEGLISISGRSEMRQCFLNLNTAGEKALRRSLPLWRAAQERFVSLVGKGYWFDLRDQLEKIANDANEI